MRISFSIFQAQHFDGVVVEVAIDEVVCQRLVVSIGIGAVTTAIDIAADSSTDTHGIAEIDTATHVVTTIDVMNLTTTHNHTGSKIIREAILGNFLHCCRCLSRTAFRAHIGLTATAIDIIDVYLGVHTDVKEDTFFRSHASLVATAIEVLDAARLQMPLRSDAHVGLVITAKDT